MKSETVAITSLVYGGDGIGRLSDGRVCFVPGVLPGEVVRVLLTEEKKRFTRGKAEDILKISEQRVHPDCPFAGKCPGCVYAHCSYAEELHWKDRQLKDFLLRNHLAEECAILAPFGAENVQNYRNKLTLHSIGEPGKYGYFGMNNKTVIPVDSCLLARSEINEILPSASGEKALLRFTEKDGAQLIDLANPGKLTETIPGFGDFEVAGDGFFQVNLPVAAKLIKLAAAEISGGELLELYCGVGVFSISLAKKCSDLCCTGIELNKKAIQSAVINAANHGVGNRCRFYAGDAGRTLKKFRKNGAFTLLVDPPRSGIEKSTLLKIMALGAEKIIYISCAADTLTRDLKELVSAGYKVKSSRVLDMFPRTAHFESLTVLVKI